jgi:predicted ArsR family transcriptional regulator
MTPADASAAITKAVEDGQIRDGTLRLYAFLTQVLDPCQALPAKQQHLAKVLGYNQAHVCRMLQELVAKEYLRVVPQGRRTSTRALKFYVLTFGADRCAAGAVPDTYSRTA